MGKKILIFSVTAIIITIMLWVRAYYGSVQAYENGEVLLQRGDYIEAVTYFGRAIHWYAPLNPFVEKSAEKLWLIGVKAAETGDTKLSLIAFRTIRNGFYAAKHFQNPGKEWIKRCDLKISSIDFKEAKGGPSSAVISSTRNGGGIRKNYGSDPFWSVLVGFGFLGWVGAVMVFIMIGRKKEGENGSKRVLSPRLPWLGLAIIFFAVWIIGMMNA